MSHLVSFPGSVIRRGLKYFSSGLVVVKLGDTLNDSPYGMTACEGGVFFVSGGRWFCGAL